MVAERLEAAKRHLENVPEGRDVENVRTNITDALEWVRAALDRGSLETDTG